MKTISVTTSALLGSQGPKHASHHLKNAQSTNNPDKAELSEDLQLPPFEFADVLKKHLIDAQARRPPRLVIRFVHPRVSHSSPLKTLLVAVRLVVLVRGISYRMTERKTPKISLECLSSLCVEALLTIE